MSELGEIAAYPSLKGRTVVVTGGASGIGESIVRHFAAQGSKVGFIDLNGEAGRGLAEELGADVHFVETDLKDIEALQAAIDNIRAPPPSSQ